MRAPTGQHTAWAYCHVPNGSAADRLEAIEGQVERFAPGFRDCILARSISPPAALASIVFAPDMALAAIRHLCDRYPGVVNEYRLPSGFNPTLARDGSSSWVSDGYLGLDQGIVVLMIENYRSQLIWNLVRQSPYIGNGLRDAGFRGGWL